MSAHTPGPWQHEGQGDITGIEDNGFGKGPVDVCAVYLRTVPGRHEANARLIAAAPELLEALRTCLTHGSMTCDDWVIEKAERAIEKATGEPA